MLGFHLTRQSSRKLDRKPNKTIAGARTIPVAFEEMATAEASANKH
jgi:hypothetical protein